MNIKLAKFKEYFKDSEFECQVTSVSNKKSDPEDAVLVHFEVEEGRHFVVSLDNSTIVNVKCVISGFVKDPDSLSLKLLREINHLNSLCNTHQYYIDASGCFVATGMSIFTDRSFDVAKLLGYCLMIDEALKNDYPKLKELLEENN